MISKKKLEDLGERLWRTSGDDWVLKVTIDLTEPACATANIVSDSFRQSTLYHRWGDTWQEAVKASVDAAIEDMNRAEGKWDGS